MEGEGGWHLGVWRGEFWHKEALGICKTVYIVDCGFVLHSEKEMSGESSGTASLGVIQGLGINAIPTAFQDTVRLVAQGGQLCTDQA